MGKQITIRLPRHRERAGAEKIIPFVKIDCTLSIKNVAALRPPVPVPVALETGAIGDGNGKDETRLLSGTLRPADVDQAERRHILLWPASQPVPPAPYTPDTCVKHRSLVCSDRLVWPGIRT